MSTLPDFKRRLVVQLYLHQGDFWHEVSAARAAWDIMPRTRVPPIEPRQPGTFWTVPHPEGPASDSRRWQETLRAIHDRVVPPEHRDRNYQASHTPLPPTTGYPGGTRESWEYTPRAWEPFLANCLLYDPPDTQLEEYAQAADGEVPPQARQPPIVWRRDPVLVADVERWYREAQLADQGRFFAGFLDAHGLHNAFRRYAIEHDPSARLPSRAGEYGARLEQIESEPYISVEANPDDAALRQARAELNARRGTGRRRGRGSRDPLRALQCAIWHDACGWTEVRIARHYGWTISEGNYDQQERSQTARDYITAGRRLHQQRNSAE